MMKEKGVDASSEENDQLVLEGSGLRGSPTK